MSSPCHRRLVSSRSFGTMFVDRTSSFSITSRFASLFVPHILVLILVSNVPLGRGGEKRLLCEPSCNGERTNEGDIALSFSLLHSQSQSAPCLPTRREARSRAASMRRNESSIALCSLRKASQSINDVPRRDLRRVRGRRGRGVRPMGDADPE